MNNKPFKCLHCGRNLGACGPHICKGTLRKSNLSFGDRATGAICAKNKTPAKTNDMQKYKEFFNSCSCFFAEGVEFMTKEEIYEAIKKEVKRIESES